MLNQQPDTELDVGSIRNKSTVWSLLSPNCYVGGAAGFEQKVLSASEGTFVYGPLRTHSDVTRKTQGSLKDLTQILKHRVQPSALGMKLQH